MKGISIYQPPGKPAQAAFFIEGLEPKLREKLLRQIIPLPRMPPSVLREPHYHVFVKKQSRDTMRALEQSLRILAEFRAHPELAVEYTIKEEEPQ